MAYNPSPITYNPKKIPLFLCGFKNMVNFALHNAAVAQLVEHQRPKLRVAGSSPVCRSKESSDSISCWGFFLFSCQEGVPLFSRTFERLLPQV